MFLINDAVVGSGAIFNSMFFTFILGYDAMSAGRPIPGGYLETRKYYIHET